MLTVDNMWLLLLLLPLCHNMFATVHPVYALEDHNRLLRGLKYTLQHSNCIIARILHNESKHMLVWTHALAAAAAAASVLQSV
jgi:hypothetical protein